MPATSKTALAKTSGEIPAFAVHGSRDELYQAGKALRDKCPRTSQAEWTALSGYMGKNHTFDKAITEFSLAYAYQNEGDHAALEQTVGNGKVKAVFEEAR